MAGDAGAESDAGPSQIDAASMSAGSVTGSAVPPAMEDATDSRRRATPRVRHVRAVRVNASATRARSSGESTQATDEVETQGRQWRKNPARRPQRVRTLKLKTQVHPDALVPFLYGDRESSINAIMAETGCSIDYCALSPDEVLEPDRAHTMNFLVSAETVEMLDEGSRRLRVLVDRIQAFIQRRMRTPRHIGAVLEEEIDHVSFGADPNQLAAERDHATIDYSDAARSDGSSGSLPQPRRVGGMRADVRQHRGKGSYSAARPTATKPPGALKRPRTAGGVRVNTATSDQRRGAMWSRSPSSIYFGMDSKRRYPLPQVRYAETIDHEQHETKAATPPAAASDASIPQPDVVDDLYLQDGEVPQFGRQRFSQLDRGQWDQEMRFVPFSPRQDGVYFEYDDHFVHLGRPAKRPFRRRPMVSESDEFVGRPRQFRQNAAPHINSSSGGATAAMSEPNVSAEQTDERGSIEVNHDDVDMGREWMNRHEVRRYHRPLRRILVRGDGEFVEQVLPRRAAYYYDAAPSPYDEIVDGEGSMEWISDEDELMYAYRPSQSYDPYVHLSDRQGARYQQDSSHFSSPQGYYDLITPDHYSTQQLKRQKASYNAVVEDTYTSENSPVGENAFSSAISANRQSESMVDTDNPSEVESVQSTDANVVAAREANSTGSEVGVTTNTRRDSAPQSLGDENESGHGNSLPSAHDFDHHNLIDCPPNEATTVSDDRLVATTAGLTDVSGGIENESHDEVASITVPTTPTAGSGLSEPFMEGEAPEPVAATDESTNHIIRDVPPTPPSDIHVTNSAANIECDATTTNADISIPSGPALHAADSAVGTEERSVDVPVNDVGVDNSDRGLRQSHSVEVLAAPPAAIKPVNSAMRMNNELVNSLSKLHRSEADWVHKRKELTAQKKRLKSQKKQAAAIQRFRVLYKVIMDLQTRLLSSGSLQEGSDAHEMLKTIQTILDRASGSDKSAKFKVTVLQKGLETLLAMQAEAKQRPPPVPAAEIDTTTTMVEDDAATLAPHSPELQSQPVNADDDPDDNACVQDSFADDADGDDLTSLTEETIKPEGGNFEPFVIKQEDVSLVCPPELPVFLWAFLMRSLACDESQSYVMKVMQNRLVEEISKSNPYYYLQRTELSPHRLSPLEASCEFGCRGASAIKWERKLISQINSRMKSFDIVAYSLARSGGGKDVLNRKKLNSIVRKVHLVAMQLHSLLSHLYCVKGRAVCTEADAMSSALNNSHFEKRMGVYKSRLKLVLPHKYHQLNGSSGVSKDPEDLVRDTFEFFPELLVCVDIWAFNYREGLVKKQYEIASACGAGKDAFNEATAALLPLVFFRAVESEAFDFDHDANGRLRCICDELLNIVCLWNDFKWMENLEALDLERIVAFETSVSSSIVRILALYAHHLQALWAKRLRAEPEYLCRVRMTQHNAYYTPRSHVLVSSQCTDGAGWVSSSPVDLTIGSSSLSVPDGEKDEDEDGNMDARSSSETHVTDEQRVAAAYWLRKLDGDQDAAMGEVVDRINSATDLIQVDALESLGRSALDDYTLEESSVEALRSDVAMLSTVASELLDRSSSSDTSEDVLELIGRHRAIGADMVCVAEKLALHEAGQQLASAKESGQPQLNSPPAGAAFQSSPLPSDPDSSLRNQSQDDQDGSWLPSISVSSVRDDGAMALRRGTRLDSDLALDAAMEEDQPVGDVIEVLAATKRQVQELCMQRARSARVREKLQLQAVELARQAAELVRNTANMYT